MIEAEGQEDGFLEMPDPATVNLTALMLEEQGARGAFSAGADGIVDGMEPAGRVKDGLLESFLQSNFPDEEVGNMLGYFCVVWQSWACVRV